MKKGLVFMTIATLAACGDDPRNYVLVHGAWNGAWVWDGVRAELEAEGHAVTAVELPGHGADTTPLPELTLARYVDTVAAAIDRAGGPVVLVGHSLGGVVVTQTADVRASAIETLVYVAAFVPKDGQALIQLIQTDTDSQLGPALAIDMDKGIAGVDQTRFVEIFCHDCSGPTQTLTDAKYRDEPLLPATQTVTVSPQRWGTLRKVYVYAELDRVISPALQTRMTADITWATTRSLATGHSPFLATPEQTAETLIEVAAQ